MLCTPFFIAYGYSTISNSELDCKYRSLAYVEPFDFRDLVSLSIA